MSVLRGILIVVVMVPVFVVWTILATIATVVWAWAERKRLYANKK